MKETVEIIESLAKTFGLFIGGIWVYLRFVRMRENHPKIEFNIYIRLLGRQDDKMIVEIVAELENKGLVRHWINNFTCDVLILKSNDRVVQGDKRINYQLLFEKYNPIKPIEENKNNRITWIPKDWYESFIDAGIKQQYTYLTQLPALTTFVSVYSQFYYKDNDFQTAQKTFSINQLEKTTAAYTR